MKQRDKAFIVLFVLSLAAVLFFVFTDRNTVSGLENRTLAELPAPSLSSFLSGDFQDQLEDALGDHMPLSETIRGTVRQVEAELLAAQQKAVRSLFPGLNGLYTQIAEGYYSYAGDEHRIVEKPVLTEKDIPDGLRSIAGKVSQDLGNVRTVLYWIDNSRSVSFDFPREHAVRDAVFSLFPTAVKTAFTFSGYEEFCGLFYQTDHHWNHRGSYKGYTEILSQLRCEETPVPAGEEVAFPLVFNGSYARQTSLLCADEPFTVYRFDLPKMAVTLNGKRGTYGRSDAYLRGRYSDEPLTNHYSNYYGGEYGEIAYTTGSAGKGVLLIVSSSYSNPVNGLLASHFDKTYVIDPRYYAEWAGKEFDLAAYAGERGVTDLLLLGDVNFFLKDLAGAAEGGDA